MVQKIKRLIAEIQLSFLFRKQKLTSENFSNFFTHSNTILLIISLKNNTLINVDKLIEYLISRNKKVTILSTVEDFNKILLMNKCSLFEYSANEINRVGLPNAYLLRRLKREKYDIVINPDPKLSVFNAAVSKLCSSKYRIGYSDKRGDKYFNIQISFGNNEPGIPKVINALNIF